MEDIEITQEILDNIKPFRGTMFKKFAGLNEDDNTEIFGIFVQAALEGQGIEVEDVFEQLSMKDFTEVLTQTMDLNNMDELFRALDRLGRKVPKPDAVDE